MYSKLALALLLSSCHAANIHTNQENEGIFSSMIEQVTAPERSAQEKHIATMRKQKQLDDAEKDYQSNVQEEEAEEAAKVKKEN